MPTQEERIAALERKVAALELQQLYNDKKAKEAKTATQGYNLDEMQKIIVFLLDRVSNQGADTMILKNDVNALKEKLEWRFASLEGRLPPLEEMLHLLATPTPKPGQDTW